MKEEKTWRSAEAAAAARACESMLPVGRRLFFDPWAKYFLSFKYSGFRILDRLGRIPLLKGLVFWYAGLARRSIIWYMDRLYPGGYGFVIARTRYIDDYLQACLKDGLDQLIILGAGFDARAHRIEGLQEKVKVFEVDQPGTLNRKKMLVEKMFGRLPDHVVYVDINFETDKLAERLLESGYDPGLKSLFIWEAVTGYLDPEAVDETLRFVAENSGRGSSIIFDYPDLSFIIEPNQSKEAATLHRFHSKIGEPPKFGIDVNRIDDFLSERGFHNVKSIQVASLDSVYFGPINEKIKISPFFHLVQAAVKDQPKSGQMP